MVWAVYACLFAVIGAVGSGRSWFSIAMLALALDGVVVLGSLAAAWVDRIDQRERDAQTTSRTRTDSAPDVEGRAPISTDLRSSR